MDMRVETVGDVQADSSNEQQEGSAAQNGAELPAAMQVPMMVAAQENVQDCDVDVSMGLCEEVPGQPPQEPVPI